MYIEYTHNLNSDEVKKRLNQYTDKLENLEFSGGFYIDDLKKSWTGDEMQVSFNLKKMVIDRRIKANFRLKLHLLVMDIELPNVVKNFITDENLQRIIIRNLDTILGDREK